MVQYYEMYWMVVVLNPSTTVGTYGTNGNLWSRSAKPSLPSVKHVGRNRCQTHKKIFNTFAIVKYSIFHIVFARHIDNAFCHGMTIPYSTVWHMYSILQNITFLNFLLQGFFFSHMYCILFEQNLAKISKLSRANQRNIYF